MFQTTNQHEMTVLTVEMLHTCPTFPTPQISKCKSCCFRCFSTHATKSFSMITNLPPSLIYSDDLTEDPWKTYGGYGLP